MEVSVLENFGREAELRMPKWMQEIVLEDVNTAVRNRIAIIEMIQNAKRNH